MSAVLNLRKNDILDLTKREPGLTNVRLGAGWDVASSGGKGLFALFSQDFDLDLAAILLDGNGKQLRNNGLIYYANKNGTGIFLHGDNLTGEGEGDDEKISVSLNKIPKECSKIVFVLTIYQGIKRKQSFSKVKNAYIRLINEGNNDAEICRYDLTGDGGENTGIIFSELSRNGVEWTFKAVGELFRGDLQTLVNRFK